jgi:hypothetical protein
MMILLYILGGVIVYFMIGFLAVVVKNFYSYGRDYDEDRFVLYGWIIILPYWIVAIPELYFINYAYEFGKYLRGLCDKWRGIND